MTRFSTPKISDQELLRLSKRLQAVVSHNKRLYYIAVPEKSGERITYLRTKVWYYRPDLGKPAADLVEVTGGMMPHPCDPEWYLAHEPEYTLTIAEVLANFAHAPAEFLAQISAFEFHGFATGTTEDLLIAQQGIVRAQILLYGKK